MKALSAKVLIGLALTSCLVGWVAVPASATGWSPYQVGAAIGVLSWLTFFCSDRPIGASSSYATAAGLLGKHLAPERTAHLKYFQDEPPKLNWGSVFMLFALVGAFLSAISSGEFSSQWLPSMWQARFGEHSLVLRLLVAFGGGALMALGARLAGGCTSGHGISGSMQLALSSWIVLGCLFAGGMATAALMYGSPI
jgi:uncharacterized membrane protein YedE/YeeE